MHKLEVFLRVHPARPYSRASVLWVFYSRVPAGLNAPLCFGPVFLFSSLCSVFSRSPQRLLVFVRLWSSSLVFIVSTFCFCFVLVIAFPRVPPVYLLPVLCRSSFVMVWPAFIVSTCVLLCARMLLFFHLFLSGHPFFVSLHPSWVISLNLVSWHPTCCIEAQMSLWNIYYIHFLQQGVLLQTDNFKKHVSYYFIRRM